MGEEQDFSEDDLVELSFLRDLETDQLIEEGHLTSDARLSSPLHDEVAFEHEELTLRVVTGETYPVTRATQQVDNRQLPRESVIALRTQLARIVDDAEERNNMTKWRERESETSSGIYEPAMVVLELAKATRAHIEGHRSKTRRKKPEHDDTCDLPFPTKAINTKFTSSEAAYALLRKTPQEISALIPPDFRVLHVEEVLRSDLARAFSKRQQDLRAHLSALSPSSLRRFVAPKLQHSQRRDDLVEHLVRPHVTFHGTQRHLVGSIIRHGFLLPGAPDPSTAAAHPVRCGSTYGRGIYSSPSPLFSLSYSDYACRATPPSEFYGIKLLVCAALMGRPATMFRGDNWREQSEPYAGADSHVANGGMEYVVFDPARIIPVYVVHLDWGPDNASHFLDLPADPADWSRVAASRSQQNKKKRHRKLQAAEDDVLYPADIQAAKQAALAKAAKYFPYGYGPATGGRFVVEAVGEADDDEEEYGDYQALRAEEREGDEQQLRDKSRLGFWSWVKAAEEEEHGPRWSRPDEYTGERMGLDGVDWERIPAPAVLGDSEEDDDDDGEGGGYGLDTFLDLSTG